MHYDEKITGVGFEPMTYGSESECATHYTTAPQVKDKLNAAFIWLAFGSDNNYL